MAGLDPAIHVVLFHLLETVDARIKSGHDVEDALSRCFRPAKQKAPDRSGAFFYSMRSDGQCSMSDQILRFRA